MNEDTPHPADDMGRDDDLSGLLRAAGARSLPSAEVTAAVREAVAAEWRAVVAARRPRRRIVPWLAAASLAAVTLTAAIVVTRVGSAAEIATIARLEGAADVRHGAQGQWQPLATGSKVRGDDAIRTRH